MRRASDAVLPKPAGAAMRTRRGPSAARGHPLLEPLAREPAGTGAGGWIFVSAKLCVGNAKGGSSEAYSAMAERADRRSPEARQSRR
jgi:hypothetical protein